MSDEASTEICAVCGKTDKEHTKPTLSGEKERRHFFEPPREASTGNEQGWQIAGHNGIVVDPATGVVTDEYARKNLRTVSIDLDRDGKYVEFEVAKGSAKELRDYLIDQAARIRALEAALREAQEDGYVEHRGACQGAYGGECTCGFFAWYEKHRAALRSEGGD